MVYFRIFAWCLVVILGGLRLAVFQPPVFSGFLAILATFHDAAIKALRSRF